MAIGVPDIIENPTNETVRDMILEMGYDLNPMKGIEGKYYTTNRLEDLKNLVMEILKDRTMMIVLKEKHDRLVRRGLSKHPKFQWINEEPYLNDYHPMGGWGQVIDYKTAEGIIGLWALEWITSPGAPDHDSGDLWHDIQGVYGGDEFSSDSILDAIIKATDWKDNV